MKYLIIILVLLSLNLQAQDTIEENAALAINGTSVTSGISNRTTDTDTIAADYNNTTVSGKEVGKSIHIYNNIPITEIVRWAFCGVVAIWTTLAFIYFFYQSGNKIHK